jgi:hypothetical protein
MNKLKTRVWQSYAASVSDPALLEIYEASLDSKINIYLVDYVYSKFDKAIDFVIGSNGHSPEDHMQMQELKSEFEWLFFDNDDHVDEDFMNETADVLPTMEILIAYTTLMLHNLKP